MTKKFLEWTILASWLVAGLAALPVAAINDAGATDSGGAAGGSSFSQEAKRGLQEIGGDKSADLPTIAKTIINFLLFLVGAIAVVIIVYAGFQYVTSAGDSSKVATAKNTIIYAVIGLIVAIMAYAIVNFVVDSFSGGSKTTPASSTTSTTKPTNP